MTECVRMQVTVEQIAASSCRVFSLFRAAAPSFHSPLMFCFMCRRAHMHVVHSPGKHGSNEERGLMHKCSEMAHTHTAFLRDTRDVIPHSLATPYALYRGTQKQITSRRHQPI
ncbi:hypothetical protein F2P81_021914 [Scophthalmus maximus]|uniref:Uncharacterized protein n=1 Tax=Scophthalmus maximus TaxID=52904 RepID=A0A6A4RSN6_SCOMX|nr:hypothetical protein F2P81_021914 [Scophthalmus maximus]